MRTGQARVTRYRDIQQTLFDENLLDDFRFGERPDARDRMAVRVVYGSPRLADASDDSGSFCSSAFNEIPIVVEEFVAQRLAADPESQTTQGRKTDTGSIVAVSSRSPAHRPSKTLSSAAPTGSRCESAVSTHPRFEVAADAGKEDSFEWRRFALGLAAGTAAGILLLAVLGSY